MTKMTSETTEKQKHGDAFKEDTLVSGDSPLQIPQGRYRVQCLERKVYYFARYNSHKLVLTFRIIEGEYEGTVLLMYINLTDNETGKIYKKFSPKTEYYTNWVIANNERLPSRNDRARMPYSIFKDGIFEVKVRMTKRKFNDGTALPKCLNYSVIDHLIKRLP